MANTDSTVRLRQLNQNEVSGYILQVISGILGNSGTYVAATGALTGAFYPRQTNPTGYLRSGEAATLYDIDNAIAQENVYIATTYYPASNPNRYINGSGVVYTTGNQTIAGIKEFSGSYITVINPINVVGVVAEGVGLDGEHYDDWANGYIIYGDEGNPTIDLGNRRMMPMGGGTFSLDWSQKVLTGFWDIDSLVASVKLQSPILYATSRVITPSIQTTGQVTGINVNQRRLIKSNGITPTLDWESGILLGTWNASGLTILGQPIVTGDINNFPNIVYTTGDQTIYGNKAFNAPLYGALLTTAGQETWRLDLVNGKVQKYKLESTIPYPLYATTTYVDFVSSALKDGNITTLDWKNRILSGEWNVERMRISGVPVSTGGGGGSFVDDGTFVRTTGNQSIGGTKNFTGILQWSGQLVTTGGPYSQTGHIHSGYVTTDQTGSFATTGWVSGYVAGTGARGALVEVFPDGTIVKDGVATKPASTTCGIQEAINMLPLAPNDTTVGGGTIRLGAGSYFTSSTIRPPYTINPYHLGILGNGMLATSVVYTGTVSQPAISFGSGCKFTNKTLSLLDLTLASNNNTTTSVLEIDSKVQQSGVLATADIRNCWFGWWEGMTGQSYRLTPATFGYDRKLNLIGIRAIGQWCGTIKVDNCHFTNLLVGIHTEPDHLSIEDCTFYHCGVRESQLRSDWGTATLQDRLYGIGAGIILSDTQWGGAVLHTHTFRGNTFVGFTTGSPCYLVYTTRAFATTSNDDSFESDAGSAMIAIRGTGNENTSGIKYPTWTFVNPKLYWNKAGGSPPYTWTDMTRFILPENPTSGNWRSNPDVSGRTRIWDMREREYYDGKNFSFNNNLRVGGIFSGTSGMFTHGLFISGIPVATGAISQGSSINNGSGVQSPWTGNVDGNDKTLSYVSSIKVSKADNPQITFWSGHGDGDYVAAIGWDNTGTTRPRRSYLYDYAVGGGFSLWGDSGLAIGNSLESYNSNLIQIPKVSWDRVNVLGSVYTNGLFVSGNPVITGGPYYLASNPSGYVTTGQTGNFATTGWVTGYVAANVPTVTDVVYTTGNQTIGGEKTFTGQVSVNSLNLTGSTTGRLYSLSSYPALQVGVNRNLKFQGPTLTASGIAIGSVNDSDTVNLPLEYRASEHRLWTLGGAVFIDESANVSAASFKAPSFTIPGIDSDDVTFNTLEFDPQLNVSHKVVTPSIEAGGGAFSTSLTISGNPVTTGGPYYLASNPSNYGTIGGSNTYIQYNTGGAFGGKDTFTFNPTYNSLVIGKNATFDTLQSPTYPRIYVFDWKNKINPGHYSSSKFYYCWRPTGASTDSTNQWGAEYIVKLLGSGTHNGLIGGLRAAAATEVYGAGSGVVTNMIGLQTYLINAYGTVTNMYNMQVLSPALKVSNSTGITSNIYGIYIADQKQDSKGNGYGIIQLGTGDINAFKGKTAFGPTITFTPTSYLHLTAGGTGASQAPFKFTSASTKLTIPEAGAMEYDGTSYYLTNSSQRSPIITGVQDNFISIKPSSSVTSVIDWSLGNTFYRSLTAGTTFSFLNTRDGQTIVIAIRNTGTQNYAVTWPTTGTNGVQVKWPSGVPITGTAGVQGKQDIYTFIQIDTGIYANAVRQF